MKRPRLRPRRNVRSQGDRSHRLRPWLEAMEARSLLATFTWAAPGGGDFNNPSNWKDAGNNPGVPGPNDDAYFIWYQTYNVTVARNTSVRSISFPGTFSVNGGTFQVAADSSIHDVAIAPGTGLSVTGGTTTITNGGTIAGPVNVASGATLAMRGGNAYMLNAGASLDGPGLYTFAEGTLTANVATAAPVQMRVDSGTIAGVGPWTLPAGRTLTVTGGIGWTTPRWNNAGTIAITGGNGPNLDTNSVIVNTGLIDLQHDGDATGYYVRGTIQNAGTIRKSVGTGQSGITATIQEQPGGRIDVRTGSIRSLTGSSPGETFLVASGASLNLVGWTFQGTASGSGGGGLLLENPTIGLAGATWNFPAGMLQVMGNLTGTASTAGNPSFTNQGTLGIDASYALNVVTLSFRNTGTIAIGHGGVASFGISTGLTLVNTGLIDFEGDGGFSGSGTIRNQGALRKSAGSGFTTLGFATFDDLGGTIDVRGGSVILGAGTSRGGNYRVAPGSSLELSHGNDRIVSGTFTATGGGLVTIDTQYHGIQVDAPGATFNFPAGMLQITGAGFVSANGAGLPTLTNTGAVLVTSGGGVAVDGVQWNNAGTIALVGSAQWDVNNNGTLNNAGTLTFQGDGNLGGNGSVVNTGTILKAGGTGQTIISPRFDAATGTVEVASGKLLAIRVVQVAGVDVNAGALNGGTWIADAGASLDLTNSANLVASSAAIVLNGAGAQVVGLAALASNSGTLKITSGASLATTGDLTNTGTITLGPSGRLNVGGKFQQSATTARLASQIGGNPASGQYGVLNSTAAATLGGVLGVELANGYAPSNGDAYPIVVYPSETLVPTFDSVRLGSARLFALNVGPSRAIVTASTSVADLAVSSVTVPTTASPGQSITIPYTVRNNGQAAPVANWVDSIYLSQSPMLDASAFLLAPSVGHTGGLAAGGSYSGSWTGTFPGLLPGSYYAIAIADSRGFVPDSAESNNRMASASTIRASLPILGLNAPASGSLGDGQTTYYELDATAGQTIELGIQGSVEVRVRYGGLPNGSPGEWTALAANQPGQSITLPSTLAGPYYLAVRAVGNTSYTLTAQALGLAVLGFSPTAAAADGPVTLTIQGAGFQPGASASLLGPGGSIAATRLVFRDSSTLFATFNLANLAAGGYAIRITNPDQSSVHGSVNLAVTAASPTVAADPIAIQATGPGYIRPFTEGVISIEYANTGTTDVPAPLIMLRGDNMKFRLPGSRDYGGSLVYLLGINPTGPLGTLPPGFRGTINVPFTALDNSFHAPYSWQVETVANPDAAFPWDQFANLGQPASGTPLGWGSVVNQAKTVMGSTWGQVVTAVGRGLASPVNSGGLAATPDPGDYDFVRLLRAVTFLTGSPTVSVAPPPASSPLGDPVVDQSVGTLVLYSVGPLVAGAPTYLITPGLGGSPFSGQPGLRDGGRYADLAHDVKATIASANVLYVDWHWVAPQSVAILGFGPSTSVSVDTQGINIAAGRLYAMLKGLQDQGLFDPSTSTFIAESYGNAVNDQVAGQLRAVARSTYPVVSTVLAFDPPNEITGVHLDLPFNFQNIYAFESCLIFDSHAKFSPASYYSVGGVYNGPPPLTDHQNVYTIYEDFSDDDSEQGVLWLAQADPRWLTPDPAALRLAHDLGWDGSVAFGRAYDPTSVTIATCFKIDGGELDSDDSGADDPNGGGGEGGGGNSGGGSAAGPTFGKPDGKGGGQGGGETRAPNDPNDIVGPAGFGSAHFIKPGGTLPYTVNFQNQPTADLPAQVVTITEQLDPGLDWSSFAFGDVGFGAFRVSVGPGLQAFSKRVDARNTLGLLVDVQGAFNSRTGLATWTFRSIDPTTGVLTGLVDAGFLPPDDSTGRGSGFVRYTIQEHPGLVTGTVLAAQASIVFDTNAAIATPTYVNTIDADPPTSTVLPLPATASGPSFLVSWTGGDGSGSGVSVYDVYVSTDQGPFQPFLIGTTATSAQFNGQAGHAYAFFSVATDNLGHRRAAPAGGQASTFVPVPVEPTTRTSLSAYANPTVANQPVRLTALVVFASPGNGLALEGSVTFLDGNATLGTAPVVGGMATLVTPGLQLGGHAIRAVFVPAGSALGSESPTWTQTVQTTALEPDPLNPGRQALAVGTNLARSTIELIAIQGGRRVQVKINGKALGTFAPNGALMVFGGPGNDTIRIDRKLRQTALVLAGNGRNTISAGGGPTVLVGGTGADSLTGGAAPSILIGGLGKDRLQAGSKGSLLIGGATAYDQNDRALLSLLAEWQAGESLASRISHLQSGSHLAATFPLNSGDLVDDRAVDTLIGGGGPDWFVNLFPRDLVRGFDRKRDRSLRPIA